MVCNVFWCIILFYIVSIIIISLNVPYNYPGLSDGNTATSLFMIVFTHAGSAVAGSSINAVLMTSVISTVNHALFTSSQLLYSLTINSYAPHFFGHLNHFQVLWVAVLATSIISSLCFGASYIGTGQLWSWLQNIVGVLIQLSWVCICIASLCFCGAICKKNLEHLLLFKNWMYPVGLILVAGLNIVPILVQVWLCFSPVFQVVDFVSFYIEIPIMIIMLLVWKLVKRMRFVWWSVMDLAD